MVSKFFVRHFGTKINDNNDIFDEQVRFHIMVIPFLSSNGKCLEVGDLVHLLLIQPIVLQAQACKFFTIKENGVNLEIKNGKENP